MNNYIYYLHTNGKLICKRYMEGLEADMRESDFVKMFWFISTENREDAWSLLIEALSLGANKEHIDELATKWKMTNEDGHIYAERCNCYIKMDGSKFCATRMDFINLQECPSGFGDNILEAMSDLCTQLGYKAQKLWGISFKELLK